MLLAVIHMSLSVQVCLGLITPNSWSGIRHMKSCFQSRSSKTSFGDSKGVSGLFNLPPSTDSIKGNLCLKDKEVYKTKKRQRGLSGSVDVSIVSMSAFIFNC